MKSNKLIVICMAIVAFAINQLNAQAWETTGNVGSSSDVIGTTNNESVRVITNDTVRLYIKPNGSVGIGTDKTTGFRLSVEGSMRAREVVVNMDTWADFVFDLNYKLMRLEELKRYIQANQTSAWNSIASRDYAGWDFAGRDE